MTAAEASPRTVGRRLTHVQAVRKAVGITVDDEIKAMSKAEREQLLAGVSLPLEISVDHSLAMKSNLGISWNKLRVLRQYGNTVVVVHITYIHITFQGG